MDYKNITDKLQSIIIISKININMYQRQEIKEDLELYEKNLKEITYLSKEIIKEVNCL